MLSNSSFLSVIGNSVASAKVQTSSFHFHCVLSCNGRTIVLLFDFSLSLCFQSFYSSSNICRVSFVYLENANAVVMPALLTHPFSVLVYLFLFRARRPWQPASQGLTLPEMMKCSFAVIFLECHATVDGTRRPPGGTRIYGPYRYVPRNKVWFLRFSVLK